MVQTRTNISAARQYNESPNFQRLNNNNSSQHHHDIHTDPYLKSTANDTTNFNHYHLSNNNNNYSNVNSATPIGASNTATIGNNMNMNKYNLNSSPPPA